jgi:galactokinase
LNARDRAERGFRAHFGIAPALLARAPGRVNLIGEHTDYNDGWCLPCAIDRDTVVAAAPRRDGRFEVLALDTGDEPDHFFARPSPRPLRTGHWGNYVRGVVTALQASGANMDCGASLLVCGDVPQGAGLSSSASLELSLGVALRALFNLPHSMEQLALAGQQAEHSHAGCQCGLMDQLASALCSQDHALLLDCQSQRVRHVRMPPEVALLVIESGIERGLVQSEYNLRREQCAAAAHSLGLRSLRELQPGDLREGKLEPILLRRARHVLTENDRTLKAAQALEQGDLVQLGRLMRSAHLSLRDDFEVSLPAIDQLVELANESIGPMGGARLTGGGFGGCVVAVLERQAVANVVTALQEGYRTPAGQVARMHLCAPAQGAELLR